MRKCSQSIVVVLAALFSGAAYAAAQDALTVLPADGSERVQYNLDDISSITFAGDMMTVTHAGGESSHAIDDIASIRFDIELGQDAIEQVLDGGLAIRAEHGVIYVTAADGRHIAVEVYDTAGRRVLATGAPATVTVAMNQMAPGVYIIKANDKVIKYKN